MSIEDTIKNTGVNSIRRKTAGLPFGNRASGWIGRKIDQIGRATGNVLPDFKISEELEQGGAESMTPEQRVANRKDQGKPVAGADTEIARQQGGDFTYDTSIGIQSDKPAYNLQEQESAASKPAQGKFTTGEAAALGLGEGDLWDGNTVTIGGQQYVVQNNGDGTRSFKPAGGGGDGDRNLSGEDKVAAIQGSSDEVLKNLGQSNIDDILQKQFSNVEDLSSELERVARENANREYDTVMKALGRQEGEVSTLARQQRENIQRQGEFAEQGLEEKQERETEQIQEEREGFKEDVEETKDQLGAAWRDMSLEIQRIMRGRGVQDSSFAASAEIDVLKDFNKGLRKLSVESAGALKDFSDAVVETTRFYERKKNELAEEVRVNLQNVDNWVRQRTADIQNRQDMALSNKLKSINNAVLQAQQLKTNINNEILQKKLDYDLWLKQTEVNYKMAVASAAQGKVESAHDKIKQAAALSKNMWTLLENDAADWVQTEDGQWGIQDKLTGAFMPTSPGAQSDYEEEQRLERQKLENQASGSNNLFGGMFGGGAIQTQQRDEDNLQSTIKGTS